MVVTVAAIAATFWQSLQPMFRDAQHDSGHHIDNLEFFGPRTSVSAMTTFRPTVYA